jgi:spectinomycin phosphotransferase
VDLPDLGRDYGLEVRALEPHPGGFDSDCLVADGTWFVKVWRTPEPPAGLNACPGLHVAGLPVPPPLPARTGELHSWWGGRPYAVFPFIRGRAADAGDWRVMARTLRRIHETGGIALPRGSTDEPRIRELGGRLDHPWIAGRAREVAENIARLERATDRAAAKTVPLVVCHRDFLGQNILVDQGAVTAVLDWDAAVLAPREHDLWLAAELAHGTVSHGTVSHGTEFLAEYGARDLDLDHLEYALLARALRDMAARVQSETDRRGIDTWGFRRIARLERDLEMFRPFCAQRPR